MKTTLTTIALSLLLITTLHMDQQQLQSVVDKHFASYDKNNDKILERNQYIAGIKQQQKTQGNDLQTDEYYLQLTDWLYQYYDTNKDNSIDLQEWRSFSKDIMDQSSPQYKQISKNPRLIEPQTEL